MFVCCECCVLSGRGLCDGLIIRTEQSYPLWRVVVCDQETSKNQEAKARYWAVKIQPQWVVTPGKQTSKPVIFREGAGNTFHRFVDTIRASQPRSPYRSLADINYLCQLSDKLISSYKLIAVTKRRMHNSLTPLADTPLYFRRPRHVWGIIRNGPTNALVCIKTLIQMSHTKTFKITPTCFDPHQGAFGSWLKLLTYSMGQSPS
jgi:hypothetical protein